jgi:hypothetical protein
MAGLLVGIAAIVFAAWFEVGVFVCGSACAFFVCFMVECFSFVRVNNRDATRNRLVLYVKVTVNTF